MKCSECDCPHAWTEQHTDVIELHCPICGVVDAKLLNSTDPFSEYKEEVVW